MVSVNFEKIRQYHQDWKTWDKKQVSDAVGRWITAEEYKEITGEEYVAPEKVLTEAEQAIMDTQEGQLIIMEAMAAQYEESLERDLENKEVQATIYEELLAINGKL